MRTDVFAYTRGSKQTVPHSAGSEPPRLEAPHGASDCHIHVYDSKFRPAVPALADATASAYRLLQKRLGVTRVVIVTPRNYATDNSVTLDAIAQLGSERARGIAVAKPDITNDELNALDRRGVRGLRFSVGQPRTAVVTIEMIEPLAKRIVDFGWHVQLNMEPDQIAAHAEMLKRLPTEVVFDHMGKLGVSALDHAAYSVLRELLDKGRAWVKLSGAYLNTTLGPPTYADATRVAQAFVKAAPERLVWGSDWPHPTPAVKPDDALLFDLLSVWAPDESLRHRILVSNPETLYGFSEIH